MLSLKGWVVFSAGVSNLALFEAEMSADAWQLMGMAERGYLPKILAQRSKFNTPKYGIVIGTLVIIAFSVADFSQLVESKCCWGNLQIHKLISFMRSELLSISRSTVCTLLTKPTYFFPGHFPCASSTSAEL